MSNGDDDEVKESDEGDGTCIVPIVRIRHLPDIMFFFVNLLDVGTICPGNKNGVYVDGMTDTKNKILAIFQVN